MDPVAQTLINGRPDTRVRVLDRGLAYGDGVFRTLRIERSQPRWWQEHLHTLARDARVLGLDMPAHQTWQDDLARLGLPAQGVMRLTLTRGEGPRGYRTPHPAHCTRMMSVWPAAPFDDAPQSVQARFCQLRLGHQPALAGIKHLNRLENVLARQEWQDDGIQEGLLLDQAGHVVCGVMSNLFLRRGNTLHTPRLDQCGVAGVARARLMAAAPALGYRVEETRLSTDDVLAADEVMLTNSLILLWHVNRLGERVWDDAQAAPRLWEALHG